MRSPTKCGVRNLLEYVSRRTSLTIVFWKENVDECHAHSEEDRTSHIVQCLECDLESSTSAVLAAELDYPV